MKRIAASGFTLVEMLVVVTILGIVAKVALPMLSSNDPQKLSVAAEETANTLRFALSEAKRTGGYVLIDGKTTAGHIKLYYSTSSANLTTAITDPLTTRTTDLNVANSTYSQGVTLTPQFRGSGTAYKPRAYAIAKF
jgi:type II secretion system protein H